MSFGPATPMSFARILRATAPGFTYDKVTYPNLPAFAETLTFDRYNDDQTPAIYPILSVPNFDPRHRVGIVDLAGLGSVDAVMGWAAQHKTLLLILGIGLVWGVATRGPKSNRRRRRNSGDTRLYDVRFVHRVAPRDYDRMTVTIPDGAFSDKKTLGRALRQAKPVSPPGSGGFRQPTVLGKGQQVRSFRVEGDKVTVFPSYGIWHAIIITPA